MDDVIKRILVDIATLDREKQIRLLRALERRIASDCVKNGCEGCNACMDAAED